MFQHNKILSLATLPHGEMKEVSYFGFRLTVPDWTRFIATDCDGGIFAFERKPRFEDDDSSWYHDYDRSCFIADVGEIRNPKMTLVCYEIEKPIVFSEEYNEAKCRRVAFVGIYVWIPSKYRWMAYDANGEVWAYKEEPEWYSVSHDWDDRESGECPFFVGTLTDTTLHGEQKAKQSKMQIKE